MYSRSTHWAARWKWFGVWIAVDVVACGRSDLIPRAQLLLLWDEYLADGGPLLHLFVSVAWISSFRRVPNGGL